MKPRSILELQDFLDKALVYRKRELSFIHLAVSATGEESTAGHLMRAAVPILYAHWEGYLRDAAIAYLNFVFSQLDRGDDYQRRYIAVAFKHSFAEAGKSRKARVHADFLESLLESLKSPIIANAEAVVDADSNLSSKVLEDLLFSVGVTIDQYWSTSFKIVDYQLLKKRNEIAHGELVKVDPKEYADLYIFVLESLERYKTSLEHNASEECFRRSPSSSTD